jgi:hypothetical protein
MARIDAEMSDMDFHVTKEAAVFATEAYIHQMCAVANLVKTCCFEGAAYTLVTDLWAPRGSRSGKGSADQPGHRQDAAPIRCAVETCVRSGKLEPREGALQYGYPTPGYDIMRLLEEMDKG